MGASGSSAAKKGLEAEAKLFEIGVKHWRTIAPHHPAIVAEAVDVPLEAAPYGDRVIHGVWCKKAADGDNNNTIEKNLAPSSMTPSTTTMPRPTLYEAAKEATPIICLHGFGAGAGLYYASLPGIAAAVNGPVYAIDWLGAGFSSRPDWADVFTPTSASSSIAPDDGESGNLLESNGADTTPAAAAAALAAAAEPKPSVEDIERFFVDGIEDLRVKLGAEKIVLLGHSLGGYIACAYAERHPDRVERLVLCGCAGVPDQPPDPENMQAPSWVRRLARWFWTKEISPFQLVQWGGKSLLGWYVNRRFEEHDWLDKPLIQEYLYNNWISAPPSVGGHAHTSLLKPGAWAKKPLELRIPEMKVANINFVYGVQDWMTPGNAFRVQQTVAARRLAGGYAEAVPGGGGAGSSSSGGGPNIAVSLIGNAGHQALLEQPEAFADACVAAILGEECDGKTFYAKSSRRR